MDINWAKICWNTINKNPNHIITRIQYHVQLVASHTIHRAQGLTFDHLVFDPTSVTRHGLTYTTLSCIHWKESLYYIKI